MYFRYKMKSSLNDQILEYFKLFHILYFRFLRLLKCWLMVICEKSCSANDVWVCLAIVQPFQVKWHLLQQKTSLTLVCLWGWWHLPWNIWTSFVPRIHWHFLDLPYHSFLLLLSFFLPVVFIGINCYFLPLTIKGLDKKINNVYMIYVKIKNNSALIKLFVLSN